MADNLSKSYESASPNALASIIVEDTPVDERRSITSEPPLDRDVELRELLQVYSQDRQLNYEAATDYSRFVHFAPHALLHNSIAEVLRNKSRQQIGMIAECLGESYLEADRDRAFAKVLDSPGPPPAGLHRSMMPAEIGALVPKLLAQNPATIDRLAELIAGDPGRARGLGPELLAEILKAAASKDVTGRYNGSRLAA